MNKFQTPTIAFVFLTVSFLFIANHRSFLFFLPAQQVELSHGVEYGAVVKNFLFVQELTMQKRYLSRIDVYMAKLPSQYFNENVFLLLDHQHRILFTRKFSSSEIGEALYFPFDFKRSFDIGKGNKVFACLYSIDGDQGSYIGLARKENSNLGKLSVIPIANNDIVRSFENQQSRVEFNGSIGVRTYESASKYFSLFQIVLYLMAVTFSLIIFFSGKIKPYLLKTRIKPEYAFLGVSLFFGLIMVVINPPFQAPDEPAHFYRSFQIAEFNIFKYKDDFPKSLVELSSLCERMQFSTHEKTTRNEIMSLAEIELDPLIRITKVTPNYTIPYIPQALGILFGKTLNLNPLWLFYLGRIFNLLFSVFLVFHAIKTTPVLKWLFFLLGIMPMTLYQFSSLSYDAITIGLSFLLISTMLNYALNEEKSIGSRELIVLFLLSAVLAGAKPPYFILAFSFLIIPVGKIGNWKKFTLNFAALISVVFIVSQLWAPGRKIFERLSVSSNPASKSALVYAVEEPITRHSHSLYYPLESRLPLLPHGNSSDHSATDPSDSKAGETQPVRPTQPKKGEVDSSQAAVSSFDPTAQKKFILDDPLRYTGIMWHTILNSIDLYMVSFVGLFGWIDTPLPDFLVYMYLVVLLLVSIGAATPGIQITVLRKCVLFAVFAAVFILVETAMYLYCNPVGANPIIAVQGRYFIAIAPIFFLLFYNSVVHRIVGKYSMPSELLPWLAMGFGSFSLIGAIYVIFERFYVFTL